MKKLVIVIAFWSACFALYGQPDVKDFKELFRIKAIQTKEPIKIDGRLEEPIWQDAVLVTDFWQKTPYFSEGADPKTEVKLAYDDNNLYVAAKCHQPGKITIQSLKRDNYWDNDGFAIVLDPLNNRNNANLFGVSAVGVQWDALNTQTGDINSDWNNKWYSKVYHEGDYWYAELAIPLKILRFNEGVKEWGVNFIRNYMATNEYHNWTAVPESFWPPNPSFAGTLVWEQAPVVQKANYNLIPFVTASATQLQGNDIDPKINAGLDGRVAVTSSLNLDLTLNSDFSQAEADELVTNLTRFNIFLPERRTFFLENSDLFSDFGLPLVRPFFSRTIGLDADRKAVPILYGLRLTGALTPSLRLGAMNVHTLGKSGGIGQNQSAFTLQKNIGTSYIRSMFVNRQGFDDAKAQRDDFGRNWSTEAVYISNSGKYQAWGGSHFSFKPNISSLNGVFNTGAQFTNSNWSIVTDHTIFQRNYYADLGFTNRVENYDASRDTTIRSGYYLHYNEISYRIRPKEGLINRHEFGMEGVTALNPDRSLNEFSQNIYYNIAFKSRAELGLGYNYNDIHLLFPFAFFDNFEPLPASQFTFHNIAASYQSDDRKAVFVSVEGQTGQFYNGSLNQIKGNINFRWQPWLNYSVGYQWNDIKFPDPYGDDLITAFLTKLEVGFSKNLIWTTILQYVDQSQYLGVNSRIQWQYSPMSNIFLVYIDNYGVQNGLGGRISPDNRALILKANYWW